MSSKTATPRVRTSPSHQRYLDLGCVMSRSELGRMNASHRTEIHYYGPCRICGAEMADVDDLGYENASGSPYTMDCYGPSDITICTRCAHTQYRDSIDLTGRIAKCSYSCGNERPSSWSLGFFEFQGEGSQWAMNHCAVCGYAPQAHDPNADHMARIEKDGGTRYDVFMEKNGGVHEFTPRGGDAGYDRYYCGCRGWD